MTRVTHKKNLNLFLLASLVLVGVLFYVFVLPKVQSEAATFRLLSTGESFAIGQTFSMDVKIDSENVGINGSQATIQFPADKIEVTKLDKTGSIFDLWLEEPSFDNQKGEIRFIAATISGFSGQSLHVLKLTFRVKGTGEANVSVSDGAITASDGFGTNVFSASQGLKLRIVRSTAELVAPIVSSVSPELASKLPASPKINIALYPDPKSWYNLSSNFSASWDLPKDIIGVGTLLDKVSKSEPNTVRGLFDNRSLDALDDGVWYLHVRFKNNIGWGVTNHYRIAIDSKPPLPFEIMVPTGLSSDNPTPHIIYETKDSFSGIKEYSISIDSSSEIKTDQPEYTLPNLKPGKHGIQVTAFDLASNATISQIEIEVLPIAAPRILSVSRELYVGEGGLAVNGSSLPSANIILELKDQDKTIIHEARTASDAEGFWSSSIDVPLKKGIYTLLATAEDSRGALSLPVSSGNIYLRERPVLTIFGFGLTYGMFLVALLAVVILSFGLGFWTRKLAKQSRQRNILIAERDVNSQLLNIKKDIAALIIKHKTKQACTPKNIENEVNYVLKKIEDNIQKNSEYILENIEQID